MGPIERELREWAEHSPAILPMGLIGEDGASSKAVCVCFHAYVRLGFGPNRAMGLEDARDVLSEAIEAASELGL